MKGVTEAENTYIEDTSQENVIKWTESQLMY